MSTAKIIYTKTDEAPALATYSLLPIVEVFAEAAGIDTMKVRFDPGQPELAAAVRRAAPSTFMAFSVPLVAAASGAGPRSGSSVARAPSREEEGPGRGLAEVGGEVVARTAIFTEGDRAKWQDIISLGHLPVFLDEGAGQFKSILWNFRE